MSYITAFHFSEANAEEARVLGRDKRDAVQELRSIAPVVVAFFELAQEY